MSGLPLTPSGGSEVARTVYGSNWQRIQQIRQEAGGNDAEALARMFEDEAILDDSTFEGRLRALLEATEHRWFPRLRTFLDVPGLQDCRGFGYQGFRPEFHDPWETSRDQVGHFLTSLGLALYPEKVKTRRLLLRLRDWVGAPRSMSNEEVAMRLIIGHEKRADPVLPDPLVLPKVRRQFACATAADVAAFRRALKSQGPDARLDLDRARPHLAQIEVGAGTGNSWADVYLSLAGYYLAELVRSGRVSSPAEIAAWVRENLMEAQS